MVHTFYRYLLAVQLLACLASFGWGMLCFFIRPDRTTLGMKVTAMLGGTSGLVHLWVVLVPGDVSGPLCWIASAVYTVALALFWWAVFVNWSQRLPACFSLDERLHLNSGGPYRFVRHPFYCSYLLVWFNGALAAQNLWLLPTAMVMLAVYATAARREEQQFVHGPLANDYWEYCNHAGQFIPKLGKFWSRTGGTRIAKDASRVKGN